MRTSSIVALATLLLGSMGAVPVYAAPDTTGCPSGMHRANPKGAGSARSTLPHERLKPKVVVWDRKTCRPVRLRQRAAGWDQRTCRPARPRQRAAGSRRRRQPRRPASDNHLFISNPGSRVCREPDLFCAACERAKDQQWRHRKRHTIGTFGRNDSWRRLFAKDSMTLMNARCDRALDDLFQHVPLPAGVLGTIRRRMCQPGRHYHNLGHLAEMWRQHRKMARGTLRTRACRTADRQHHRLARCSLSGRTIGQRGRFRRLVAPSRQPVAQVAARDGPTGGHSNRGNRPSYRPHAGATCEPWVQWVLDLDLSPIGLSPHRVQANGSRLRAEHRNLSAAAWQQRSKQFYGALQRREHIFHSATAAQCVRRQRAAVSSVRTGSPALTAAISRVARNTRR